MSSTRIEKDTMGEMAVPADAYYAAQTARALANFPVGGGPLPRGVIQALGMLKGCAAAVNQSLGGLDDRKADAIQRAAAEVVEGKLDDQFVVDVFQTGSGTSSNMNTNEVIANRASELLGAALGSKEVHPNDHVNMGQSSNDIFPSAVQLGLASVLQKQLLPAMGELAERFHKLADAHWDRVKTGRTHLMDAMPIRYGQVFRGYAGHVERHLERIEAALASLCELPLGGTAVGTGVNCLPGFPAKVCMLVEERYGIPVRETTNHFQAQSCMDPVVAASGALRGFATSLFKIANDIRWMASGPLCGLGEFRIPAVQPGSSIMPAKVNPVILESVLMLCVQVIGNDAAVAFGNTQGQFELNTMFPLMGRNSVESATLLANGIGMLGGKCLDGLEVTEEGGRLVHANPILATALNAEIGYETAAAIAKESAKTGRTVAEIAAEKTDLAPDKIQELLDPARLCGEAGKTREARR